MVVDASQGDVLYRFNTGGPVTAGVITYAANGKQYVGVASGATAGFWRSVIHIDYFRFAVKGCRSSSEKWPAMRS